MGSSLFIPILKGIATCIPGLYRPAAGATGGTASARYCYSVWMRHMTFAAVSGLETNPRVVAEVGPGDSLGIGLSALLAGADTYYAFDVVQYANHQHNAAVFHELAGLFERREPIPDDREFPHLQPRLDSYEFPHHIMGEERLRASLQPGRVAGIERAIAGHAQGAVEIKYIVPWFDDTVLRPGSVDMVISQAVMEHLEDPRHSYQSLERWLKPGGYMSHLIDFGSHNMAREWNGHWTCGDLVWRLIKGRRPYLLNRESVSVHEQLIKHQKMDIVQMVKVKDTDGVERRRLARRFAHLSDEDLTTRCAFIQAVKNGAGGVNGRKRS